MRLVSVASRDKWQTIVEQQGMDFHTAGEIPYWVEDRAYCFEPQEIALFERTTYELQRLCLKGVEHVIRKGLFNKLAISEKFIPLILSSWEADDPSLYGRFDLSYDGVSPPKMLEYNADTPTGLLESSVIQYYWLQDQAEKLRVNQKKLDQFNFIHEEFVRSWQWYAKFARKHEGETLYFACINRSLEDLRNVEYMQNCASQAGISTQFINIQDIGWTGSEFVDLEQKPIRHLFKLYPWEMLVRESFGEHLLKRTTQMIEPAWKMILSNKALLPILWELFPDHPHLLPSYFSPEPLGKTYVRKPIYSREGANIQIVRDQEVKETQGRYGAEGHIYQKFAPLPRFENRHAMIGSWVVGGVACGICIRDSQSLITDNLSCFVPHYFENPVEDISAKAV